MRRSNILPLKRLLITASIPLLCASAQADLLTFNFDSVITALQVGSNLPPALNDFSIGDHISGTFILDTNRTEFALTGGLVASFYSHNGVVIAGEGGDTSGGNFFSGSIDTGHGELGARIIGTATFGDFKFDGDFPDGTMGFSIVAGVLPDFFIEGQGPVVSFTGPFDQPVPESGSTLSLALLAFGLLAAAHFRVLPASRAAAL